MYKTQYKCIILQGQTWSINIAIIFEGNQKSHCKEDPPSKINLLDGTGCWHSVSLLSEKNRLACLIIFIYSLLDTRIFCELCAAKMFFKDDYSWCNMFSIPQCPRLEGKKCNKFSTDISDPLLTWVLSCGIGFSGLQQFKWCFPSCFTASVFRSPLSFWTFCHLDIIMQTLLVSTSCS